LENGGISFYIIPFYGFWRSFVETMSLLRGEGVAVFQTIMDGCAIFGGGYFNYVTSVA
jgi:hypothetical protein